MLTLDKFEEASEIVQKVILPTNLIYSEYYSAQTGGKIYLKPENMQYTGAYKIRGAYYKISTLPEEERQRGLITASAGNHAQGVAYAAKLFGVKAVIVMPNTTPLIKVNRTRATALKSFSTETYMTTPVPTRFLWRKRKDIRLFIRLMMKSWLPDRVPSLWRLLRSCRR